MKAGELYRKVSGSMRMGMTPSLPLITKGQETGKETVWFYYCVDEEKDGSSARIEQISTADDQLRVRTLEADLKYSLDPAQETVPELGLDEYYEMLARLYDEDADEQLMWDLLAKGESKAMLGAYHEALKCLEENRNALEEEPAVFHPEKERNENEELILNAVLKKES